MSFSEFSFITFGRNGKFEEEEEKGSITTLVMISLAYLTYKLSPRKRAIYLVRTQKFPFLPPDTQTHICVSGCWKC